MRSPPTTSSALRRARAGCGALALSGIASVALIDNKTHASISHAAIVRCGKRRRQRHAERLAAFDRRRDQPWREFGSRSCGGLSRCKRGYRGIYRRQSYRPLPRAVLGHRRGRDALRWIDPDGRARCAGPDGRPPDGGVGRRRRCPSRPAPRVFAGKAKALKAAFDGGGAAGGATAVAEQAVSNASSTTHSFSIDIAGSSSVSVLDLDTSAYIDSASVNRKTASATGATANVSALNNVMVDNGSGSAAINLLSLSAASAAVAGAIASRPVGQQRSRGSYTSTTPQSTTTERSRFRLSSGGQQTAIAIGLAVSTGSNGGAGSASASIGIITDSTVSYISNSTLVGVTGTNGRGIVVDAYQTTQDRIGGGSLTSSGGQAGVGVALTYASIWIRPAARPLTHIFASPISQFDTHYGARQRREQDFRGRRNRRCRVQRRCRGHCRQHHQPDDHRLYRLQRHHPDQPGERRHGDGRKREHCQPRHRPSAISSRNSNNNNAAEDVSGIDFNGTDYRTDPVTGAVFAGLPAGSAIYAGAGLVQAGKNNVGFSLLYNTIAQTHLTYIAHVQLTVTSGGDVLIAAGELFGDSGPVASASAWPRARLPVSAAWSSTRSTTP